MKRRYFDAGSFTPLHKKAYQAIQMVLRKQVRGAVGNPLSTHHHGREADAYVAKSREILARIWQMQTHNIVFTSGATEANFLAVQTAVLHALRNGRALTDMHVLIGGDEHSSVFKILEYGQTVMAVFLYRHLQYAEAAAQRHAGCLPTAERDRL